MKQHPACKCRPDICCWALLCFVCRLIGLWRSQVNWLHSCWCLNQRQNYRHQHQRIRCLGLYHVSIHVFRECWYLQKPVFLSPYPLHSLDIVHMCLVRAFLNKGLAACFLAPGCRRGRCDRCLRSVKAVRFCLSQSIWGHHNLRCAAHVILLPVMAVADTTSDSTIHLITPPFQAVGPSHWQDECLSQVILVSLWFCILVCP